MKRTFVESFALLVLSAVLVVAILGCSCAAAPPRELQNSIGMKFVVIQPGRFVMGSNRWMEEGKPAHEVRITRSFQMGKYEVTQAQWEAVMGNNPSQFKGPDLPVENVSWSDAQEFLRKLNERNDGYGYRLPTEAEWEYAARAGGDEFVGSDLTKQWIWEGETSDGHTHPVGQKNPNAWGLYDMLGNVWEWCQDWYDAGYYKNSPAEDPQGPASGTAHSYRGGDWSCNAIYVQVAIRGTPSLHTSSIGFRCVRAATVR
jgi:formylglycine-generating enzyme required for sulfatase activity